MSNLGGKQPPKPNIYTMNEVVSLSGLDTSQGSSTIGRINMAT